MCFCCAFVGMLLTLEVCPANEEHDKKEETMSQRERREQLTQEWTNFLSHPSVEHSLNVRLELTLKQRRDSDLDTERPRDESITVRVPGRRFAVRDAPLFAPYLYLTEDETRRIAIRLMNRLNKELFGHAARRKHDPQRLTALVCHHDKGTRRHLHVLLALPPYVTMATFRNALSRACRTEPFLLSHVPPGTSQEPRCVHSLQR